MEVLLGECFRVFLVSEVVRENDVLTACCKERAFSEGFQVVCICEVEVGLVLPVADPLVLQLLDLCFTAGYQAHGFEVEVFVSLLGIEVEREDEVFANRWLIGGPVEETCRLRVILDNLRVARMHE